MKPQAFSTKDMRDDVLAAGILGLEALRAAPGAGVSAISSHPGFTGVAPRGEGLVAGINPDGLRSAVELDVHMPQVSGAVAVRIVPGRDIGAQAAPALANKGISLSSVPTGRPGGTGGMKG